MLDNIHYQCCVTVTSLKQVGIQVDTQAETHFQAHCRECVRDMEMISVSQSRGYL